MPANFEYWTAVFPVGLEGFSDFDHEELNAIAEQGWEPFELTAVHGGFAVVVLFRRALRPPPPPARAAAPAAKATKAVKKATKRSSASSR